MIRYKQIIEDNFLIDEPKLGQLVPFKFNKVQALYYDQLIKDYDIENKGIASAIREVILKARREGFSSFVLALFAADDLTQDNPTESLVISYRDDATDTFRKRYRLYVTSFYAQAVENYTLEQIRANPVILDQIAQRHLSVDGTEIELKQNKAHFYCGTASARVGGRGGVLQKLLFSEAAFYPDTEKMAASEIIDATLRQVDIASGMVFVESTANGYGNYYEQMESAATRGESRFKARFYGWTQFYTEEEIELIKSEFTDKKLFKQEYPKTREEAYIASGSSYFDNEKIVEMIKKAKDPSFIGSLELKCQHDIECRSINVCDYKIPKFIEESMGMVKVWEKPIPYHSYIIGADVSEGVNGDYSIARVIDARTLKTVAKFKDKLCPPDQFAIILFALGVWYNSAYMGVEVNKDGLWVNSELFKMNYPNMYFREAMDDITHTVARKLGFKTSETTRTPILAELRKVLANHPESFNDPEFLGECLVFVRNKVGRPEAMSGKHDDDVISHAIALEIRRNAPEAFHEPVEIPQTGESYVLARLDKIKSKRYNTDISQNFYLK